MSILAVEKRSTTAQFQSTASQTVLGHWKEARQLQVSVLTVVIQGGSQNKKGKLTTSRWCLQDNGETHHFFLAFDQKSLRSMNNANVRKVRLNVY